MHHKSPFSVVLGIALSLIAGIANAAQAPLKIFDDPEAIFQEGWLFCDIGEHERAALHFEQALTVNRAMGAATWVAHTLYDYGRMLRMRGRHDEAEALP